MDKTEYEKQKLIHIRNNYMCQASDADFIFADRIMCRDPDKIISNKSKNPDQKMSISLRWIRQKIHRKLGDLNLLQQSELSPSAMKVKEILNSRNIKYYQEYPIPITKHSLWRTLVLLSIKEVYNLEDGIITEKLYSAYKDILGASSIFVDFMLCSYGYCLEPGGKQHYTKKGLVKDKARQKYLKIVAGVEVIYIYGTLNSDGTVKSELITETNKVLDEILTKNMTGEHLGLIFNINLAAASEYFSNKTGMKEAEELILSEKKSDKKLTEPVKNCLDEISKDILHLKTLYV